MITRRKFITHSLAFGGAALAGGGLYLRSRPRKPPSTANGFVSHLFGFAEQNPIDLDKSNHHVLAYIDWATFEQTKIDLPIVGHKLMVHPSRPNEGYVLAKYGHATVKVDFSARAVASVAPAAPGRIFYGHGDFTRDGSHFIVSEVDNDSKAGSLVVRDGKTFQELSQIDSGGRYPHDCFITPDDKYIHIVNETVMPGMPSNISTIDLQTGKVVDRVECARTDIRVTHISPTVENTFVVVSCPHLKMDPGAEIFVWKPGSDLRKVELPAEVKAQAKHHSFNVAVSEHTPYAAVTYPYGGFVAFIDWKTAAFIKKLDFTYPNGVAVTSDKKYFVISAGGVPRFVSVDRDLTLLPQDQNPMSGSIYFGDSGHALNTSASFFKKYG